MKNLALSKNENEIREDIRNFILSNIDKEIIYSEEENFKIYVHINKINEKAYFGQTKQVPEIRWKSGAHYSSNVHFTNSISKYSWEGFYHIILFDNLSLDSANYLEEIAISLFETMNPKFGYNKKYGGNNHNLTEDIKKKISDKKKGFKMSEENRRKFISAGLNYFKEHPEKKFTFSKKYFDENPEFLTAVSKRSKERFEKDPELRKTQAERIKKLMEEGKISKECLQESAKRLAEFNREHKQIWSEERKLKRSNSLKEKPIYRFKVILEDTLENKKTTFDSLQECSDFLKINRCTTRIYIKEKRLFRDRYFISYEDKEPIFGRTNKGRKGPENPNSKKIEFFKEDSEDTLEFETLEEATKFFNLKNHTSISNVLNGRSKSVRGWKVRYKS